MILSGTLLQHQSCFRLEVLNLSPGFLGEARRESWNRFPNGCLLWIGARTLVMKTFETGERTGLALQWQIYIHSQHHYALMQNSKTLKSTGTPRPITLLIYTSSLFHVLFCQHVAFLLLPYPSDPWNSKALEDSNNPMIKPNSPRTELKISITRILTKLQGTISNYERKDYLETHRLGSAASANAAPLPLIPTEIPQIRLHIPTVKPAQNNA